LKVEKIGHNLKYFLLHLCLYEFCSRISAVIVCI